MSAPGSCQAMANPAPRPKKTTNQIEQELMERLQQRHAELKNATEHNREIAHARFQQTLQAFTAFIIDGTLPDDE